MPMYRGIRKIILTYGTGLEIVAQAKLESVRNTANARQVKEFICAWEGKDKKGRVVCGEVLASGEMLVNITLRRQGAFQSFGVKID